MAERSESQNAATRRAKEQTCGFKSEMTGATKRKGRTRITDTECRNQDKLAGLLRSNLSLLSYELRGVTRVKVLIGGAVGHVEFREIFFSLLHFELRVDAVVLIAGVDHVTGCPAVFGVGGHHETRWTEWNIRSRRMPEVTVFVIVMDRNGTAPCRICGQKS